MIINELNLSPTWLGSFPYVAWHNSLRGLATGPRELLVLPKTRDPFRALQVFLQVFLRVSSTTVRAHAQCPITRWLPEVVAAPPTNWETAPQTSRCAVCVDRAAVEMHQPVVGRGIRKHHAAPLPVPRCSQARAPVRPVWWAPQACGGHARAHTAPARYGSRGGKPCFFKALSRLGSSAWTQKSCTVMRS